MFDYIIQTLPFPIINLPPLLSNIKISPFLNLFLENKVFLNQPIFENVSTIDSYISIVSPSFVSLVVILNSAPATMYQIVLSSSLLGLNINSGYFFIIFYNFSKTKRFPIKI